MRKEGKGNETMRGKEDRKEDRNEKRQEDRENIKRTTVGAGRNEEEKERRKRTGMEAEEYKTNETEK